MALSGVNAPISDLTAAQPQEVTSPLRRTVNCELRTANCKPRTHNCELRGRVGAKSNQISVWKRYLELSSMPLYCSSKVTIAMPDFYDKHGKSTIEPGE